MTEQFDKGSFEVAEHAVRFIDADAIYHVTSRMSGGLFLMKPDKDLDRFTVGLLVEASELFPNVVVYGAAFLSNHFHLQMAGPCRQFSGFVGYLKRQLSRELGRRYHWRGTKWATRFKATCLPTPKDQDRCLRYILSQGVKENLVDKPQQWPGTHCAKYFVSGAPLDGYVVDGTSLARVRYDEKRRGTVPRQCRSKTDFCREVEFRFVPLPHLAELSTRDYCRLMRKWIGSIVKEYRRFRKRHRLNVLGVEGIRRTRIDQRSEVPSVPWLERNRVMLVWTDTWSEAAGRYISNYHVFQAAYREAVAQMRKTRTVRFPSDCHPPPYWS